MLNDPNKTSENDPVEVRCYFVRERNALVTRADFGTVYRDYYLHLMQHEIKYPKHLDEGLKEALAGLALHLASKPRNEAVAWTLSWQDPLYNLFVTGSNRLGNITGRLFTDDIQERDSSLFISQVSADGEPNRQSTIEAGSESFFKLIEDYYHQSEQRPARIFRYSEEDFVMVSAQPDCDLEWFHGLTDESIRELDSEEDLSLLEQRYYTFDCGCSLFKLLPVIASMSVDTLDDLFCDGPDVPVMITCPRCGARYGLTRDMLDAYIEKTEEEEGA